MSVQVTPHLNFRASARSALEFYQAVFGGELVLITYGDAGVVTSGPGATEIMWGQVASPDGFRIMAYDVPSAQEVDPGVIPFFVSVRGNTGSELEAYWAKLVAGGSVVQPLAPAGWSPLYGMVRDKFGVTWVLDQEPQNSWS